MLKSLITITRYETQITLRQAFAWLTPIMFFVMVTCLFPLALGSDSALLTKIAPGIIWVAALLATLISIGSLFKNDAQEGYLDNLLLSPLPLTLLVTSKVFSHWLTHGLPLVLISPLLGCLLNLTAYEIGVLMLTLLLGTPVLSLLGAIGAALTVGLRNAGLLLPILIMPLYIPVLIFGTGIMIAAHDYYPISGYFAIMGALFIAELSVRSATNWGSFTNWGKSIMYQWSKQNLLSTKMFYQTTSVMLPWLMLGFALSFGYGLIAGLFIAPADYQQGDGFRIIYVHVPSAFLAMAIYAGMAISAVITLVWRVKIAAIAMLCSASIGAWFTFLALVTGSIWGKPMWGTWWIWDARLTSVLILFFQYLGFIALQSVITDQQNRERACAVMAVVGVINLPIIHYSVQWWNTLHQGPTISKLAAPSIAGSMLYPLLSMIAAFFLFYACVLIIRMRNQVLLRDRKTQWVKEVLS